MTDTVSSPVARSIFEWAAAILEVPQVAPADNFLDLGGHSMLALELNTRVQEAYGVELDMQTLFEGSLREVAEQVAELDQTHAQTTVR